MQEYGVIYKIRNKINNKIYFGQTIQKRGFYGRYFYKGDADIERVFKFHLHLKYNNKPYNEHLLNAISKYGFDCWDVDTQFDIASSEDELNKLEGLYIKSYKTYIRKFGYNNKFGGDSNKLTGETKLKISRRAKLRVGNLNPFYGKHHSEETKDIIRQEKKGKKFSHEINMKKGRKGSEHASARKIICINTNEVFNYLGDACVKYNLNRGHLCECCQGKRKSCGNIKGMKLVWKYYDDFRNPNDSIVDKVQSIITNNKNVLCITTNKAFISCKQAAQYYGIKSQSGISAACRGKLKYCGKLENGTKLEWKYINC
ncbi:NUMOD3 domain-containing DNA-binding protein [Clostridium cadaveris]|uniref:NUMOD3 domain-containing DNA-binding protein n=1 Tax=Clostridium cadaveris TaxID=1529 RepID=UPI0015B4BB39|nr:NUMOD3 domain-containing DNA-binding protein [Clostridium cadaveris]NWK11317.1 hypothetical protein [Clostridium cadaveris]